MMEIVISINDKYLLPATVMLCSLYENNKIEKIRVHALTESFNEKCMATFDGITEKYGQEILYYEVKDYLPTDLPLGLRHQNGYITIESYYRLFVASILPSTIDKVLYLDSDIVVCKCISDLWEWNIDNVAIAAAPTTYYNDVRVTNRLGYDVRKGYFNAGVILINLKYWREHQAEQRFVDYVYKSYQKLFAHDQDVLNYVWQDEKVELPIRFNLATSLLFKDRYRSISFLFDEQIRKAFDDPTIIHFTEEDKPWFKHCVHPLRGFFEKYRRMTVWKDFPLKRQPIRFSDRMKRLVICIIRKEWSYSASFYDDYYVGALSKKNCQ